MIHYIWLHCITKQPHLQRQQLYVTFLLQSGYLFSYPCIGIWKMQFNGQKGNKTNTKYAWVYIILWGWLECFTPAWSSLESLVLETSLDVWSCSNFARTSTISGLFFGSVCRHCTASAAAAWAAFLEYWPPNLVSMILNTRLASLKKGFAQSTSVSSMPTAFSSSIARLPHSNSSNTTPKLYTSLFGVKWPALLKSDFIRKRNLSRAHILSKLKRNYNSFGFFHFLVSYSFLSFLSFIWENIFLSNTSNIWKLTLTGGYIFWRSIPSSSHNSGWNMSIITCGTIPC